MLYTQSGPGHGFGRTSKYSRMGEILDMRQLRDEKGYNRKAEMMQRIWTDGQHERWVKISGRGTK